MLKWVVGVGIFILLLLLLILILCLIFCGLRMKDVWKYLLGED